MLNLKIHSAMDETPLKGSGKGEGHGAGKGIKIETK